MSKLYFAGEPTTEPCRRCGGSSPPRRRPAEAGAPRGVLQGLRRRRESAAVRGAAVRFRSGDASGGCASCDRCCHRRPGRTAWRRDAHGTSLAARRGGAGALAPGREPPMRRQYRQRWRWRGCATMCSVGRRSRPPFAEKTNRSHIGQHVTSNSRSDRRCGSRVQFQPSLVSESRSDSDSLTFC